MHLLTMAVLLVLSGFFSASETALFSLGRADLRKLERSPGFLNGLILKLRSDPQGLLTTVLFGNMLVNVLYFCLAAAAATSAPTPAAALTIGLGSLAVILIAGEVLPKAVAVAIPLRFSAAAAAPLFFFKKGILPIRRALTAVTKISGAVSGGEQAAYVTPEELQLLIRATGERGQIAMAERDMMHEIMEFGETRVREVMLPRVDVVAVEADDDAAEVRRLVEETNITTMPVYEDDIDNIIGVVSAPDVLLSDSQRIRDHVQPVPLFVPETARIETVLHEFREQRRQFGIVVDEYGGFAGILTLEDIVEEIVGDISDEFDVEKAEPVRQLGPDKFVLSGGLSIRDWSELFGLDLDLAEVETLGGFITLRLGRLPGEGESVALGNLIFTVQKVSRRRVTEVLIERVNGGGESGP